MFKADVESVAGAIIPTGPRSALLLGGSIGLFVSPGGAKVDGPSGEIALSIAALGFLAGYSVEVVFRVFDALIEQALRVVNAIAPPGSAPPRPG